jgi:hypothetical protein
MKFIFPLLAVAFLILPPFSFAASPLQAFLAHSFEPDSGVQAVPLLANGSYYLISAGGNETYVVGGNDGLPVREIDALTVILVEDTKNREGYQAKVSSAEAFASVVDAAKAANEAKCVQYIGDDGDPGCNDRQSCLVSCFSVPQCEIIVQSDGFLESAMDWDSKRKEFSSALAAYSDGIEAVATDPAAIDAKISVLSSLSSLAANMSQNSIFLTKDDTGCSGKNVTRRCYEYCPAIDYSSARIPTQMQSLASLKATISTMGGQGARAAAIASRGAQNDAYLSTRGTDFEEFRLRTVNGIRNLKAGASELAATVKDPQIAPAISQLENISARAKNLSDAGFYQKALGLRAQFESVFNATSAEIRSDNASYASLLLAMDGFSAKAKSSAWLIGNSSTGAHLARLSALRANYTKPLTLQQISAANASLSELGAALSSEIAAKAVQAGNSSQPPPIIPSITPELIAPGIACFAGFVVAVALAAAFILRATGRHPPKKQAAQQPPPPQKAQPPAPSQPPSQ